MHRRERQRWAITRHHAWWYLLNVTHLQCDWSIIPKFVVGLFLSHTLCTEAGIVIMKVDGKKAFFFVCGTAAAILILGSVSMFSSRSANAAGDVQAGKAKAVTCAGCHGANGQGVAPNPRLAGLKEDKLIKDLKDYRSGKRGNAVMKAMTNSLSGQDIENLAAYFASLK